MQADSEFSRKVRVNQIRQLLEIALRKTFVLRGRKKTPLLTATEARCTIHVRDILFSDSLLQLLDYYPNGQGAMRRFSIRYGAIGRTWRLKTHFQTGLAHTISELDLIEKWGMTEEESKKDSRNKPSYLCVMIKNSVDQPIAIIYLDSKKEKAFGDDDQATKLCESLASNAIESGLVPALENLTKEMNKYAADINIEIR